MDTSILTALIGAVVLLGATWLGAYLNRKGAVETARQLIEVEHRKYAQSRLWDAKKDAYTDIVAQFNAIDKDLDGTVDRLFDPDYDPQPYIDSDEYVQDNTAFWRRINTLWTTIKNNGLILSDDFQAAFVQWNVELIDYDAEDEARKIATVQSKATKKYIPIIVKIAKAELEAGPKTE